ncbi:hypothetical protein D3C87_1767600 [compost metagenome]
MLEHLKRLAGEASHIGVQVVAYLLLTKVIQGEFSGVVEALTGCTQQQFVAGQLVHRLGALNRSQHLVTGRGQHTFQTAKHGERQDNAAILGLLEITSQQVGYRPDEIGKG